MEELEKLDEEIGHRLMQLGEALIIVEVNNKAIETMKAGIHDLMSQRKMIQHPNPNVAGGSNEK